MKDFRSDYHPGNLTDIVPFTQPSAPPLPHREVVDTGRPVLYDSSERPIYRRVGFTVTR
jgi:hypothetical protein